MRSSEIGFDLSPLLFPVGPDGAGASFFRAITESFGRNFACLKVISSLSYLSCPPPKIKEDNM